ncbi:MAG: hypothetical protein KDC39_10945 [Actinobacteria bacterium]|nr:hypothetical protein [Actinomycetota bacterium]
MILTLFSASGAPGVTTTALAMASFWPRPVTVLETTLGSAVLAGFLRGQLAHDRGVLGLAAGHRDGTLTEAITTNSLPVPGTACRVIPGFTNTSQSDAFSPGAWRAVAEAFQDAGEDLIVDAGRVTSRTFPEALVTAADARWLMLEGSLPSIAAAHRLSVPEETALLSVGSQRAYSSKTVARQLSLPRAGHVPWEPQHARVFSHGATPVRRLLTSEFSAAMTHLVTKAQESGCRV